MKCERHPGGAKVHELGVCPAAVFSDSDGFLGGRNGGRACLYVAGTLCGGSIQGTTKDKEKECFKCDYFHALQNNYKEKLNQYDFLTYQNKKPEEKQTTPADTPWHG